MKKIVIIAGRSGMTNELSARVETLFPECEISIVSARHENHKAHSSKKKFLKQDIGNEEGHILASNLQF